MRQVALLSLSALLACSGGKPAQQVPSAPANVVANAGDGQVTVLWDPVAGAVSYALYTADGAGAAARTDVGAATSWTAVGLTNGHTYRFSVSAVGVSGEGARSVEVTATPAVNLPLAVAVMPADGTTSVARNTSLTLAFNKAITFSSATTGTACTGSVLLSSDNFSTCVALAPPASADNKTVSVTPAQPLSGATAFKLRITRAVKDANGIALAADFTSAFTTSAQLTATASIDSTIPLRPVFTVSFNRPPLASSVTFGPSCSGAVRLSSDSFVTCVPLSHAVVAGVDTFSPTLDLPAGASFHFQVGSLKDSDGVPGSSVVDLAFSTPAAFSLSSIVPADGTLASNLAPSLVLVFSAAIDPATLTLTTSGTACTGSLQVSSDSFATCIALIAPAFDQGNLRVTTRPAANLAAGLYKVKVTTAVHSATGLALAAESDTSFAAGPGPTVSSTSPASGTTGVARNSHPSFTFTKPVKSPLAAGGAGACTGPVQLSSGGTCLAFAAPSSGDATTFNLNPGLLAGNTTYALRIADVQDVNGVPMAAPQTFTFTTAAALAIASRTPADGSINVANLPALTINFSRAALGVSTGSASCADGTLQLFNDSAPGTCLPLKAASSSNNGTSWSATPVQALAPGSYHVKLLGTVTDSDGVALGSDDSWAFSDSGQAEGAPLPVTNLQVVAHANSVDLSWTPPSAGSGFAGVHIYVKAHGAASYPATFTPSSVNPFTLQLTSGGSYDILVKSFNSSGVESTTGAEVSGIATDFSGTSADFLAGQTATGGAGGSFYQGWTDNEFIAGFTLANGQTLGAANGDALWIGFSTTGASTETETVTSPNGGSVIWPFGVDFIVEIKNTPGGLVENLRAGGVWCSSSDAACALNGAITASINSSIVEVRFNKSVLGSPATARVAMLAVATHSFVGDTDNNPGYVFDLAPASVSAIDTFGTWGSLTSSYAPDANIFHASKGTSTTTALMPAPALVSFSVSSATAFTGPDVKIKGSLHPFSYDLTASVYQLDISADLKTASGTFNLGGQQGELFFKFNDHGADEPLFGAGKDRVYALGANATESVPSLAWSTAGATGFVIDFVFATGGNPTGVGGDQAELGNYNPANAAGPVVAVPCSDFAALLPPGFTFASSNCYDVQVTFPAGRDLVTAPMNFKAVYDSANFEDPSRTHVMDDDVINHRYLFWNAGDFSTNY
jgi:hypothetical protein